MSDTKETSFICFIWTHFVSWGTSRPLQSYDTSIALEIVMIVNWIELCSAFRKCEHGDTDLWSFPTNISLFTVKSWNSLLKKKGISHIILIWLGRQNTFDNQCYNCTFGPTGPAGPGLPFNPIEPCGEKTFTFLQTDFERTIPLRWIRSRNYLWSRWALLPLQTWYSWDTL